MCTAPSGIIAGATARPGRSGRGGAGRPGSPRQNQHRSPPYDGRRGPPGQRSGRPSRRRPGRPPNRCRGPRRRSRRSPMIERCRSSSRCRTSGTDATALTWSVTACERIATATSRPSTVIVGPAGSVPETITGSAARAAMAVGSSRSTPCSIIQAVHGAELGAGVEVAQAQARRDTPRGARLARSGRPVHGNDDLGDPGRSAQRLLLLSRLNSAGASATLPVSDPFPGLETGPQLLGGCVLHHQLDQADGSARVVVDVQVLDVDPDLARRRRTTGPAPPGGRAPRRTPRRWPARDRRACRGWPACRRPRGSGSRSRLASSSLASTSTSRSSSSCTSRRISLTAAWFARMIWLHMSGSPAAIRVTSRTPWPESDRCSGRASASCPAVSTASRCGRCEVRATARSCSTGESAHRLGAAQPGERLDEGDRLRRGVHVRGDRPRPARRTGRRRGEGARALAARHRVAAHVAGEQVLAHLVRRPALSGRPLTLPTSVTTPPRSRASTTAAAM